VKPSTDTFKANVTGALGNAQLQGSLSGLDKMRQMRRRAVDDLPEFDALRDMGRRIRDHALSRLADLLAEFEERALASGSQVHWAQTRDEACRIAVDICRSVGARRIVKGKSMVSEEMGLNDALIAAGYGVVESDVGEYILQLADEPPSHLVAPALHKSVREVADLFAENHGTSHDPGVEAEELVAECTGVLRRSYFAADVGITGANFLVAETGSTVLVTNEGNGDFSITLPRCHISVTSIEKVLPTLDDLAVMLRLLGRSATGQEMTVYTTLISGPRKPGDLDGPEQSHIILLDSGRSELLGGEMQDALRCIRCAACLNHCPVYQSIGGQAYGWVYPGPIGAVLNPALLGHELAVDLPHASTLCGACEEACPVQIPLPRMLRAWRRRDVESRPQPLRARWAMALWRFVATRPTLYGWATGLAARIMRVFGRRGRLRRWPLLGAWTARRDLPAPAGRTFQSMWRQRDRERPP
jgi:L-lactate dehydrogenase complex protein LldF